jgi:D-glycero-beta-D-manno-heptose 1-phosphate adenylyltransferase
MPKQEDKIVLDYSALSDVAKAHRTLGHRIVCTIGSWDMLHIGHLRYLNKAKEYGDILIVGVDSDRGIKSYKGDLRPIIPQQERMEMLTYQNCVDYVTLLDDIDNIGNWQYELIKRVPMDVFVAVQADSYPPEQLDQIKLYCPNVESIPRQALQTSSTDIIQVVLKTHLLDMVSKLTSGRSL